jgi:hypothetical protein
LAPGLVHVDPSAIKRADPPFPPPLVGIRAERERDDLAKIMRERQGMEVSGRGDVLGEVAKERAKREEAERLLLEERVRREGADAMLEETGEVSLEGLSPCIRLWLMRGAFHSLSGASSAPDALLKGLGFRV